MKGRSNVALWIVASVALILSGYAVLRPQTTGGDNYQTLPPPTTTTPAPTTTTTTLSATQKASFEYQPETVWARNQFSKSTHLGWMPFGAPYCHVIIDYANKQLHYETVTFLSQDRSWTSDAVYVTVQSAARNGSFPATDYGLYWENQPWQKSGNASNFTFAGTCESRPSFAAG